VSRSLATRAATRAAAAFFALALTAPLAQPLAAQASIVGTEPDKSPYQSIVDPTRVGGFGGLLFVTDNGPGVTPKSPIPIVGIRYDYHITGPTYFNASLASGHTTRTILDYNKSAATRNIGEKNTWLMALDVGFDLAPTGDRSWKGIQPLTHLGAGYVFTPGDTREDASGYTFGGKFSVSMGFGVRWVTGKNREFRADLGWRLWKMTYPGTYQSTVSDPIAIMPTGSLDSWTANRMLTVGYTWGVFR
jgi:hypothetical protein